MFARSSISKIAVIALVAVTFSAIGALAGQSGQPAPAGAADNSAAMLGQLKILNAKIGATYEPGSLIGRLSSIQDKLDTLNENIGSSETSTFHGGLRGEMKRNLNSICEAINHLTGAGYYTCT